MQAAEQRAKEGSDCEVIDLYSLSPLDREGIKKSLCKTHRAISVEEA